MGHHDLIKDTMICWNCGINVIPANRDSCPPWSSTGEGITDTNRTYEAGEVKILSMLKLSAEKLWQESKELDTHCNIIGLSAEILSLIEILIQKRDGSDRN